MTYPSSVILVLWIDAPACRPLISDACDEEREKSKQAYTERVRWCVRTPHDHRTVLSLEQNVKVSLFRVGTTTHQGPAPQKNQQQTNNATKRDFVASSAPGNKRRRCREFVNGVNLHRYYKSKQKKSTRHTSNNNIKKKKKYTSGGEGKVVPPS